MKKKTERAGKKLDKQKLNEKVTERMEKRVTRNRGHREIEREIK